MKTINLLVFIIALLFSTDICGQVVKYERIKDLSLCIEDTVIISIRNNKDQVLDLSAVKLKLPCNLELRAVLSGGEIISINSEATLLKLKNLAPDEVLKLSFTVLGSCDIKSCIDDGELFRYVLDINGSTFSSPFFNMDTPGLNIIKITPDTVVGVAGKLYERTIIIKNTRPGKLANFVLVDSLFPPIIPLHHLEYTYSLGNKVISTAFYKEVHFDKTDFNQIGNKDDYFDFNEEVRLVVTIKVISCNSGFTKTKTYVRWGCGDDVCQIRGDTSFTKFIADVPREGFLIGSKLKFQEPFCYTGSNVDQELILYNTSGCTYARDIEVFIYDNISAEGILDGSVNCNKPLEAFEVIDPFTTTCGQNVNKIIKLTIDELNVDDTIKITWKSSYCSTPGLLAPQLDYKIRYFNGCLYEPLKPDSFIRKVPLREMFPSNYFFEKDKVFLSGKIDSIKHIVISNRFNDYNGKVRFTYTAPCNIEFQTSNFINYFKKPTYVNIDNSGNLNKLILEYELPFDNHGLIVTIPFKVDCEKDCGSIVDSCGTIVVTSCNDLCSQAYIGQDINVKMEIIDTIMPCPDGLPVTYYSEPIKTPCFDSACPDTLAAYLDHSFLFERTNYGYADNDNDDRPELNEAIDVTKVKKHAVLVGDTIQFIQNGKIVVDKLSEDINHFTIQVDVELFTFQGNNSTKGDSIYRSLLFDGGLDFSDHQLILKDKNSNTSYPLDIGEIIFNSSLENIQIRYSLDELKSKNLLPQTYKFKTGDSLYFDAQVIVRKNFPSEWKAGVIRRNIFSRMLVDLKFKTFFSESLLEDIDDIYVCQCDEVQLEMYSFYPHFNILDIFANDEALYCEGQTMTVGFISNYYGIKPEIFTHEVRELFPIKAISVNTKGLLKINKMHVLAYGDEKLIYNNQDAEFIDFGDSTVHFIPANVVFGELTEIRMEIKMTLQQNVNIPGVSDFVTIKFLYDEKTLPPYFTPSPALLSYEVPFGIPNLKITENQFNLYNKRAEYKAKIFNEPYYSNAAANAFMYFDPNSIPDFIIHKITSGKTGKELQKVNGLYQLDEIRARENLDLIFDITSSSCKDEILNIFVGWSCDKVNSLNDKPTGEIRKLSILLKYFPGVIDMAYDDEDFKADLCSNFDTIRFTIVNGELGSIHDMRYKLELPRGMSFIPGSFTLKHPYNGQSISFPDPVAVGGNVYSFVFDELLDKFDFDGLKGLLNVDEHLFDVTFIAETNCDFISGTKIIHRAEAKQKCGIRANKRAKVSPYFLIEGLDTLESVDITPDKDITFDNCSNTVTATLLLERTEISDDKIWNVFLKVPEGITIVGNKVKVDGVEVNLIFDGVYYNVSLPSEKLFCVITFDLTSTLDECEEVIFAAFTTIPRNAFCVKTNTNCSIQQVTGDSYMPIAIRKPKYVINNTQLLSFNANRMDAFVEIENKGITSSKLINLKLLYDANGDYKPDNGEFILLDTLIKEAAFPKFTLNINKEISFLKPHQLCNLIVVISDENNCICTGDYALFNGAMKVPYSTQDICWNEIAELKFDGQLSSSTYTWHPLQELSCNLCTTNFYNPVLDINPDTIKHFYLTDNVTSRCNVEYEFIVNINPKANIELNDSVFCKGEVVTLSSVEPKNNQWTIDGNVVGTDQEIELVIESPVTIYLSNSANKNCGASDTFYLAPYIIPAFSAGDDRTLCFKNNVSLNAIIPDQVNFKWIDKKGNLSDILISDPFIIENESSIYILEVCNNTCCDYDSVNITFSNNFDFNLPYDTVTTCIGDTLLLSLNDDLIYLWSDNVKPYCLNDDCTELSIPIANTSIQVDVVAIDSLNCISQDGILISGTEFLIGDQKNINLCEGDSILINNQIIKSNGTICDTTINLEGCKVISCTNVTFNRVQLQSSEQSICEGSSFSFYDQSLNSEGRYCKDFQNQFGCDSSICVELIVNPTPIIVLDSFIYNVAQGTEITIEEKGNHNSYQWTSTTELSCNNCNDPSLIAEEDITLNLIVANAFDCKDTATLRINVINQLCFEFLQIPNAFTPNDNNRNDVFRIVNGENLDVQLFEIYNEWGQKIFETNNNDGWNGMIDGVVAPQATYAFVIKASCNNESKTLTGYVSLLR